MIDLTTVPRILAKLEYSAVRLPIAYLDECVLALYWDEDAPPRSDVRYFLGSLDEVAGWLLADDEIARRGETLLRRTRAPEPPGAPGAGTPRASTPQAGTPRAGEPTTGEPTTGEPPAGEPPRAAPPEAWSAGEATDATTATAGPDARDQVREDTAGQVQEDTAGQAQEDTAGQAQEDTAGQAQEDTAGQAQEDTAGQVQEDTAGQVQEDTAGQAQEDTSATAARAVSVAFTLPADVDAHSVALCGDFNDWSAEATALERGDDGTWQVSIPLEPGRSYRYRYVLDGERWENGQADRYEPNPYGGVDSVIVVE
jgi:Carbohydrate-binding module 48 (Isoamylase N-terminal domain)